MSKIFRIDVIEKYLWDHQKFKGIEYKDTFSTTYRSDSLLLRLFNNLDDFELNAVNANHPKANEIEAHREHLSLAISDNMAVMRELIDWYISPIESDTLNEVDGFTDDLNDLNDINDMLETARPLPKVTHDETRDLIIYVWGRKKRSYLHHKVEHNFNAAVLHGKKAGTDWTKDGRTEAIRDAVMKCKDFNHFMEVMIDTIEKKNCSKIGINCRAGRHRSVTCAIILQMHYYPNTIIHFLEL